MLVWSFNKFFTLAKLKMPLSQQWNMIETSFKTGMFRKISSISWEIWGRALIRTGALIAANMVHVSVCIVWAYYFSGYKYWYFHINRNRLYWNQSWYNAMFSIFNRGSYSTLSCLCTCSIACSINHYHNKYINLPASSRNKNDHDECVSLTLYKGNNFKRKYQ